MPGFWSRGFSPLPSCGTAWFMRKGLFHVTRMSPKKLMMPR